MTRRSKRRLRTFAISALASAFVVLAACFALNCLVDPLWYLRGNQLGHINYPFNERMAKVIRFLPRMQEHDCVIFGTSRATMLPERDVQGYRCVNLAFSSGQVHEYLRYARYLRQRGFAPKLVIVEVRRSDLIGPEQLAVVPEFIAAGEAPPSIFASYLTLNALDFSIRTMRGQAPHHRYYDKEFEAHLSVRSTKRWYNPSDKIKPMPPPHDVDADRARHYHELRQQFPMAQAIGYVSPESAWRVASFSLTPAFDPYLAAIGDIAAHYDIFLDFSPPSPLTTTKLPKDTYDGVHYSRDINRRVLAELLANRSEVALDWRGEAPAAVAANFRRKVADFIATTGGIEISEKKTSPPRGRLEEGD